jgi:rubrerythrin
MIKKYEKIIAMMDEDSIDALATVAQKVSIRRANIRKEALESLLAGDFERVDAVGTVTADGREVLVADGVTVALRPEIHAERREKAFADAAQRAKDVKPTPKAETPGEALTSVLCPSCQSVMAKQPVCPNCSKGKAGFKILCACTECGHEVYL